MSKLPKEIGPHEGIEFQLMRDGKKDISFFQDYEPEGINEVLMDGFELLMFSQKTVAKKHYFTRIIFRKGFEKKALRLKELIQNKPSKIIPSREHEVGSLLSYTEKEVEAYLSHINRDK